MSEVSQTISTGGATLNYRPRQTYYLGNSGSVREILAENHVRGGLITPEWRRYHGHHGSILNTPSGTFDGVGTDLTIPETVHVTTELEARLQGYVRQRQYPGGGGANPPTGTFG